MKYFVILMLLFLVSCHDDCNPESTRCQGDTVQICNSEGDWECVADCTTVEPNLWECCENSFIYDGKPLTGCVLLGTCELDGGL